MALSVEPCRDDAQLREYIDEHWRKGHVLARDPAMFDFQYRTPWVDTEMFPLGTSVLCTYSEAGDLVGFLGAIVAPYPRPYSLWLALWHVLPETKGTGIGGQILRAMQDHCTAKDGWIGTFGAGSEAVPVYLKRSYAVRAVRRWVFDGERSPTRGPEPRPTVGETGPPEEWLTYRYDRHPTFNYSRLGQTVVRTEDNDWGRVTHALLLGPDWPNHIPDVFEREQAAAKANSADYLLDCWTFDCPGSGWTLAAEDLPSLFHPPDARGNLIYASGRPFMPATVSKGDCDQDRPN